MKKAKSPVQNKENDGAIYNSSPSIVNESIKTNKNKDTKATTKSPSGCTPNKSKNYAPGSFKNLATPQKAFPRTTFSRNSFIHKGHENEKIKTQGSTFKKMDRASKINLNMKKSKKSLEGMVSERHSTEKILMDNFIITQKTNRNFHPNYQSFKETLPDKNETRVPCSQTANQFIFTDFRKSKAPSIENSLLSNRRNSPPGESELMKNDEPQNVRYPILNDHLDTIEKKFMCMQRIFASQNQKMNVGQLSVFLSKLGWISELDKNLEIQRSEEEILVDTIFEGLNFEGKSEIQFSLLKNVLAIISAIFTNKTIPKCFEFKEQNQATRRTSLSNRKSNLDNKQTQNENKEEIIETSFKPNITKVQSCTSSPTQLSKYNSKFDHLAKPIGYMNDNEMQFSFRKASDQRLINDEMELFPSKLEYIDASHLNSAVRELKEFKPDTFCSEIVHSVEDNTLEKPLSNSDPGYQVLQQELLNGLADRFKKEDKRKESLTLPENDRRLSKGIDTNDKKNKFSFSVTIEIGIKNENLTINEDDNIKSIVEDFVKKHNIMDKYSIVFNSIQDNYQKLQKRSMEENLRHNSVKN